MIGQCRSGDIGFCSHTPSACTVKSVASCGLGGDNVPVFICWFWPYINCLLASRLPYFLLSLYIFLYLFTSLLVYFLTYLSTSSRIGSFCFQGRGRRRSPNLALVYTSRCYASAVYADIMCSSMYMSVCPTVSSRHCIKMTKRTIMQITPLDSLGTLVFCRQRSHQNSNRVIPIGGTRLRWGRFKLAIFVQYLAISQKWYKIEA